MSIFLDDKIVAMYDDFMDGKISFRELKTKHREATVEYLHKDPTLTNFKRLVNALNFAVDRIVKKYGKSILKKLSYDELYKEIFQ